MKNTLLFLVGLTLISCNYDSSTNLKSGGNIINPSDSPLVTINYRVNQEAIRFRSSLNFLNELKTFKETNIPSSWPMTSLPWLEKVFRFIHQQEQDKSILSMSQGQENSLTKLLFKLEDGSTFKLLVNYEVDYLTFNDENEHDHVMKKLTNGEWSISISDEELRWNPKSNILCYQDSCINL